MTQTEHGISESDFSPAQRERVIQALVQKFGPAMPACSMCRFVSWRIASRPVAIPSLGMTDPDVAKNVFIQSPVHYICIALICQNCGNTVFLDTDKLGLDDLVEGKPIEGSAPGEAVGS